jgi:hypothetical protein
MSASNVIWTVFLPGGLAIWRTPKVLFQQYRSDRVRKESRNGTPGGAAGDFEWAMGIQEQRRAFNESLARAKQAGEEQIK